MASSSGAPAAPLRNSGDRAYRTVQESSGRATLESPGGDGSRAHKLHPEDAPEFFGCARRSAAGVLVVAGVVMLLAGAALLCGTGSERHSLRNSSSGLVVAPVQEWAWGTCPKVEKDTAYLFTKPLKHFLEHVPGAHHCCRYCQATARCKAWTWLESTQQCFMEDVAPVKNISMVGYWSGTRGGVAAGKPGAAAQADVLPAASGSPGAVSGHPAALSGPPVVNSPPIAAPIPAPAPIAPVVAAPAATSPVAGAIGSAGVGSPIKGGAASQAAFSGFLAVWRDSYKANDGSVPELVDASLPHAFHGISTKIVVSSGGAAGGVVTEGMGYGIMVEAFRATAGDKAGLSNGLALLRGWVGMVYGPEKGPHPFGGGTEKGGATHVDTYPYGVSAIAGTGLGGTPTGVAGWKFPTDQCYPACQGSATDGDEDAVLGMVYLAAALGHPEDFVDMVMRAVIAFASADLGFPDLYRTLPDGTKVFVPKGGSQWGGLLPEQGKFKSSQEAWCYNPSYFAPGHYRAFRDFARKHWRSAYDQYLPPHLDGTKPNLGDLAAAFDGAVVAGYNILYYSSCASGAVGNWVGVKAECPAADGLSCAGVPWSTTPYVGTDGTCTASGTTFGSYGPDASRTPWRIAMDYILYTEESSRVRMYNRAGQPDPSLAFNARAYLNRMARQYTKNSQCDAAKGDCRAAGSSQTAAFKLSVAFDQGPDMTCDNVPNAAQSWWAAFMAWPTFTAFVAPLEPLTASDSAKWLDTFASICKFGSSGPSGNVCASTYFELGQEVIASMVMAGAVVPVPASPPQMLFK